MTYMETDFEKEAESQLVGNFRAFSEDKKARLLAYMNMLENTKE